MARLLEDLQPGEPVLAQDGTRVGEIRAVYGLGNARSAEYLLIYWTQRGEEALLAAEEVSELTAQGVILSKSAFSYEDLAAFDPALNPSIHRL